MKKKIAIIGSRDLCCRITSWIANQKNVKIIGVISPPFKGWWHDQFEFLAKQLDIPLFDDLDSLLKKKPDIVFSINFWKLVEKKYLALVPEGFINIHHSYLLKYRGRYSTSWAIMNARKKDNWIHGTTLHYIAEELDSGPIIDSYMCKITEEDTAESLFLKVEDLAFEMFKNNFERLISGPVSSFIKPDPDFSYYDRNSNLNLNVNDELISLTDLYDITRAWSFKDRPKPFIEYKGRRIYLSFNE